eukprot:2493452-Prorocentrum_lima.AAC.1
MLVTRWRATEPLPPLFTSGWMARTCHRCSRRSRRRYPCEMARQCVDLCVQKDVRRALVYWIFLSVDVFPSHQPDSPCNHVVQHMKAM